MIRIFCVACSWIGKVVYRLFLADVVREEIKNGRREHGPLGRVHIHPTAVVNDALFNTGSGSITVGEFAFFGHGVSLLTGTHVIEAFGLARQRSTPSVGRDIVIEAGAWVGTNATIIGPCTIGRDAVVAAGAVVTRDVPPLALVAGVPARIIRTIHDSRGEDPPEHHPETHQ